MSGGNLKAGGGDIQAVDASVDGPHRIVRVVRDACALDPRRVGDHEVEAISGVQSLGQIALSDLDAIGQIGRSGVVADERARHRVRVDRHQSSTWCGECQGQKADVAGAGAQLQDAG